MIGSRRSGVEHVAKKSGQLPDRVRRRSPVVAATTDRSPRRAEQHQHDSDDQDDYANGPDQGAADEEPEQQKYESDDDHGSCLPHPKGRQTFGECCHELGTCATALRDDAPQQEKGASSDRWVRCRHRRRIAAAPTTSRYVPETRETKHVNSVKARGQVGDGCGSRRTTSAPAATTHAVTSSEPTKNGISSVL
jgi:hypothetical protein